MLTKLMVCLTIVLLMVVVTQKLENRKLKKRCKYLTKSRLEWVDMALETDKRLRLTRDICNTAFKNVIRYKSELRLLKEKIDSGGAA